MSGLTRTPLSSLALAALLVAIASPIAAKVPKAEIDKALKSPNSQERFDTWQKLDPEDEEEFKILIQILKKLSWYDRQAAYKRLATAGTSEVIEKLVTLLRKDKDPSVRQGVAVALAEMKDPKFYAELFPALDDADAMVRRAVVHRLQFYKDKGAVEALVQRFQKEEDPVVRAFLEASLNELTQAFRGPDPLSWLTWWEEAKKDESYELGKTDEESKKAAEDLGLKLKERTTVSVAGGVDLVTLEKGSNEGVPILIIPPYSYSEHIMLPFLSELEKRHKLHYIKLPPVKNFKNLKTVSDKAIPYYPIDQLVEAFEDLRKATGEEHFAIMACEMNSWIAMRYAQKHPKSVAGIIFVAPLSNLKAYADATRRLEELGKSKGDTEMHYFALTRRFDSKTGESLLEKYHKEKGIPEWPNEGACIDRRSWSLFFKDERDYVIEMLYPKKDLRPPMGSVAIPDFDLQKEPPLKQKIPTLIIVGEASLYTSVEDAKAIAKYYKGIPLVYKNSSCMPFCEESARFNKDVAAFLKKFTRARKPKGDGEGDGGKVASGSGEGGKTEGKADGKAEGKASGEAGKKDDER